MRSGDLGPVLLGFGGIFSALVAGVTGWLTYRGSGRRDAVDGFDKLTTAQGRRLQYVEQRLTVVEEHRDRMAKVLRDHGLPVPPEPDDDEDTL